MNKQRINEIISSPGSLQYSSDISVVNELIHSFPYFSTPYVMLSRMLHDENSIYFDKHLKISAAYIGNREVLYNYIHKRPHIKDLKATEPQPAENHFEKSRIGDSHPALTVSVQSAPALTVKGEPENIPADENKITAPQASKPPDRTIPELLQYPVSDYFGQYYKKGIKPNGAKETPAQTIEEPVAPPISGKKSFSGWLDALESREKKTGIEKVSGRAAIPPKDKIKANTLIDKFISTEPKIRPQQLKMYKPEDMAKLSVVEDHHIATETLADIYLKQGLKTKALEIFQQLILKFPEKSGYFAARIKEIQSEGSF